MINGPLLRHTWRSHGLRVALIALALGAWGFLMPVIYATFGVQMEALLRSGIIPDAFLRLLGADPFSLSGAVALGSVHPVALGLQLIYPVGFAAMAIAGERQRGTLEVLLSRPVSRRSVFATLLLATAAFALMTTIGQVGGTVIGATLYGVAGQLDAGEVLFLALNTGDAARGPRGGQPGRVVRPRPGVDAGGDRAGARHRGLRAGGAGHVVARRRVPPAALAVPLPPPARDPGRPRGADGPRGARSPGGRGRRVRAVAVPAPGPRGADLSGRVARAGGFHRSAPTRVECRGIGQIRPNSGPASHPRG